MAADSLVVVLILWVGRDVWSGNGVPAWGSASVSLVMAAVWIGLLGFERAYDARFLGTGPTEYQRVATATAKFACLGVVVSFLAGWQLDRLGAVGVAVGGLVLLFLERNIARRILHRRRANNSCSFRVLALGDRGHVAKLITSLRRGPDAGFLIVGACTPDREPAYVEDVPVVGAIEDARAAADALGADVIAVTPTPAITHEEIRELGWALEGSGIDLVLAPSLTDIAGPRISLRPVSGLPLLYIEEPDLSTARNLVKGFIDVVVAGAALLLSFPFLLLIAWLIRWDSPGPVLFKQFRVGKDGRLFKVWKFRTMSVGAESLAADLSGHNESDGLLFKMKADPRITRVGEYLRRWSLDELPQLVNVLKGEMSLIGPRPLPVAPEDFQGHERRRLLVKPGVTGLWQVSGRSDTNWAEAVRLDLYYVENWSVSLDAVILWKTIVTVLRRQGAY